VARTIRTDGPTVAAKPLDTVSRKKGRQGRREVLSKKVQDLSAG